MDLSAAWLAMRFCGINSKGLRLCLPGSQSSPLSYYFTQLHAHSRKFSDSPALVAVTRVFGVGLPGRSWPPEAAQERLFGEIAGETLLIGSCVKII